MIEASLFRCKEFVRGKLLDIGCGRKPYQRTYFAGASSYVGLDSQSAEADIIASALHLPLEDESFDTVVSTELLEHVPDPERALREMFRVLKPAGHLILSAPMYWPRHEVPHDYFRYSYDGLLHLLNSSGFTLVRMFNRGNAYVFLGQVVQHTLPVFIRGGVLISFLNSLFLWLDRIHHYDAVTLGWTVVAQRDA